MAVKKTHPGLDAVISDEALHAFTGDVPPELAEAPVRVWPTVVLVAVLAATAGITVGFLVAPYVTVLQVMLAVGLALGGAAAFTATAFDAHPAGDDHG